MVRILIGDVGPYEVQTSHYKISANRKVGKKRGGRRRRRGNAVKKMNGNDEFRKLKRREEEDDDGRSRLPDKKTLEAPLMSEWELRSKS